MCGYQPTKFGPVLCDNNNCFIMSLLWVVLKPESRHHHLKKETMLWEEIAVEMYYGAIRCNEKDLGIMKDKGWERVN